MPRDILAELRNANIARNKLWDVDNVLVGVIGLLFFSNELGGEAGEAQNKIKKLTRKTLGFRRGSFATPEEAMKELADVVIVADLLANLLGGDLRSAIIAKHNETSNKIGLDNFMEPL